MAEYLAINLAVLTAVSLLVTGLWLYRRYSFSWPRFAAALIALLVLTVVFDSLLIWLDVFRFDDSKLLGIYLVKAPLEDLLYSVVSLTLAAGLWQFLKTYSERNDND